MTTTLGDWTAQQLSDFLAAATSFPDEEAALRAGVERIAEALDAEVAAVVRAGGAVVSVGFPRGRAPDGDLVALARAGRGTLPVPGAGPCRAAFAALDEAGEDRVVVARSGEPLCAAETQLLHGMVRVLDLAVRTLRAVASERAMRTATERQTQENVRLLRSVRERELLLERLSRIQSSISHRASLQEVLDSITRGAAELTGDEVVILRLIDTDEPGHMSIASAFGLDEDTLVRGRRALVGEGAGGQAIATGRLVVIEEYPSAPQAPAMAEGNVTAAMAAPVHEQGRIIGSLTVASTRPARRYSATEREVLVAFAEHASLALTDARTVEAVQRAFQDSLTGLANRDLFMDRVDHALAARARREYPVAVLFIDLDRFKPINDTLGHEAGDQVLLEAANRLRRSLRKGDTAARLGGDEFAVLVEDRVTPEQAARIAQRILDALNEPMDVLGREVFVGASIGIAFSGDDVGTAEELMRSADVAMYRAKHGGKGRFALFEPRMHEAMVEHLEMQADLRRAHAEGELVVHYQPIVRLATGTAVAVEALLRWNHPRHGLLESARFVPVAEETGLIVPIGWWVLDQACRQVAAWRAHGDPLRDLVLSVNLCRRQILEPGLIEAIQAALEESGLPPAALALEVTEESLVEDRDAARARLAELRQLGVGLVIDDFGTGYSSLSHLSELPVHAMKVPRPFVAELGEDGEGDSPLARGVVELGRSLDLVVIAEGIEHAPQAQALRAMGCGIGQGYHFARPAPAAEVGRVIRRRLPYRRAGVRAAPATHRRRGAARLSA